MASPFEVATDNTGRVNHFVSTNHPDMHIQPEDIGEYLDGDERVFIKDVEYNLTENGSLVHPNVDVIEPVALLPGVRLDDGVVFHTEGNEDNIVVGERARVRGTEIHHGVSIGGHAFVLARSIGNHTMIGTYVRIGADTTIGPKVSIADTAKIDIESQISRGVQIGENARLGFNTRVGEEAVIGERARIGVFAGAGSRGVNQDGPLILPRQIVPPSAHIKD